MSKTAVGPETTTLAVPYRFSTEQFDKMVDAGAFGEDDVELLGGAIYPIMTENEPHQLTVERVAGMLRRTLPADQWHVREEKHVEIADDWKPRPDVHVLRGSFEDYWRGNRRPGRHVSSCWSKSARRLASTMKSSRLAGTRWPGRRSTGSSISGPDGFACSRNREAGDTRASSILRKAICSPSRSAGSPGPASRSPTCCRRGGADDCGEANLERSHPEGIPIRTVHVCQLVGPLAESWTQALVASPDSGSFGSESVRSRPCDSAISGLMGLNRNQR